MHKLHRIYRYALFLVGRFKYLVLFALIAFLFSTTVLYIRHPDQAWAQTRKGLPETAFGVFELMFASQPSLPYPKGDVLCQIIFFALPVLNMLGLAAAVAKFSQILFDRGLYNRAQAETADGHVILCGLGRLGREVLRQLDQRHNMKRRRDVVVVDSGTGVEELDSDLIRREPIIPVIRADMTHAATLREAGIERAAAVVILTGNDTPNLECALLAHEINPRARVVVRMSNKRISQRLDSMLRHSQLQNFQLVDSVEGSAPECLARALFASEIAPSEGDQPPGGSVIICGLGRLGIGVVRLLKGRCPVTVIDSASRPHYACEPAITTDPPVPLIHGDMTLSQTLQDAGIASASAVLILTPNDTENLEAAMVAHELNPKARIVMRITNSRISRRLELVLRDAFGDTLRVIDPAEHAAPCFVEAVTTVYQASVGS